MMIDGLLFSTGSGKSYTMMGAPGPDEGGIIPRLCDALFERIARQQSPPALTYKVIRICNYTKVLRAFIDTTINCLLINGGNIKENPAEFVVGFF